MLKTNVKSPLQLTANCSHLFIWAIFQVLCVALRTMIVAVCNSHVILKAFFYFCRQRVNKVPWLQLTELWRWKWGPGLLMFQRIHKPAQWSIQKSLLSLRPCGKRALAWVGPHEASCDLTSPCHPMPGCSGDIHYKFGQSSLRLPGKFSLVHETAWTSSRWCVFNKQNSFHVAWTWSDLIP